MRSSGDRTRRTQFFTTQYIIQRSAKKLMAKKLDHLHSNLPNVLQCVSLASLSSAPPPCSWYSSDQTATDCDLEFGTEWQRPHLHWDLFSLLSRLHREWLARRASLCDCTHRHIPTLVLRHRLFDKAEAMQQTVPGVVLFLDLEGPHR